MKTLAWIVVTMAGFGLMLFAHYRLQAFDPQVPWSNALMMVGQSEPGEAVLELDVIEARVLLLPMDNRTRGFVDAAAEQGKDAKQRKAAKRTFEANAREKLIRIPDFSEHFTADMLQSGSLPQANGDEVIAGHRASVRLGGLAGPRQEFTVVGVLKPEVGVFSNAYLLPANEPLAKVGGEDADLYNAYLLPDASSLREDADVRKQLSEAFDSRMFAAIDWSRRLDRGPFHAYMAGMALLLLGGSLLFRRLYTGIAARVTSPWFEPLHCIAQWPRLFLWVHVVYFGLYIVSSLLVYEVPEVQLLLLTGIRSQIASGEGLLGAAGEAYGSGNIAYAAAVTLAVNFLAGSLAYITLPSCLLPGVGVLLASVRALLWGLLLAPASDELSLMMLPHSFTLLLEGEAYILGTFFALMVPIYLFRESVAPGGGARFLRALLLNAKANLFIFIVLLVAAIYEATEVIIMAGL